jgi:hypothetical protein
MSVKEDKIKRIYMLADKYNVKYTKKTPASVILDGLPVQVQREFRIPKMMGGKIKKTYAMGGGIRKANYK